MSGASNGISLCSFTTFISTPAGITSATISLVFLISNGIAIMDLKTMRRKNYKHREITLLASSKLDSIEKIISKALIHPDISHN